MLHYFCGKILECHRINPHNAPYFRVRYTLVRKVSMRLLKQSGVTFLGHPVVRLYVDESVVMNAVRLNLKTSH